MSHTHGARFIEPRFELRREIRREAFERRESEMISAFMERRDRAHHHRHHGRPGGFDNIPEFLRGQRSDDRRYDDYGRYDDDRRCDRGHGDDIWSMLGKGAAILTGVDFLAQATHKVAPGSMLDRLFGFLGLTDSDRAQRPDEQQGPQGEAPAQPQNLGPRTLGEWLKMNQDGQKTNLDISHRAEYARLIDEYNASKANGHPDNAKLIQANAAYKHGLANLSTSIVNNYFGGQNGAANKDQFIAAEVARAEQEYQSLQALTRSDSDLNQDQLGQIAQKITNIGLDASALLKNGRAELPPFDKAAVIKRAEAKWNNLPKDQNGNVTTESFEPLAALMDQETSKAGQNHDNLLRGQVGFEQFNGVLDLLGTGNKNLLDNITEAKKYLDGLQTS